MVSCCHPLLYQIVETAPVDAEGCELQQRPFVPCPMRGVGQPRKGAPAARRKGTMQTAINL